MPVLLLTLETLLFIAIDRKMYGTFYTPTISCQFLIYVLFLYLYYLLIILISIPYIYPQFIYGA